MNYLSIIFLLGLSILSSCSNDIGIINDNIYSSRVVNGTPAKQGELPNLIALTLDSVDGFFCSGLLMSNRQVLTAAHCIYSVQDGNIHRDNNPYLLKNLKIYQGLGNTEYLKGTHAVQEIYIHPDYDKDCPYNCPNDFAYIILKDEINISPKSFPQLPKTEKAYDKLLQNKTHVLAVGFGEYNSFDYGVKHKKWLKITEQKEDRTIIAGNIFNGIYSGDSGGAIFVKDNKGHLIPIGLTSEYVKHKGVFLPNYKAFQWIDEQFINF